MTALLQAQGERLRFDSDLLPEAERFAAYALLYGVGADVERGAGPFRARLRGFRLDRALLYDRHLTGVGHRRDGRRVERNAFDHFTLTYVVGGQYRLDIDEGAPGLVPPGSLVLADTSRPGANGCTDAHVVTLSMARERVAAAGVPLDGLHGLVVPPAGAGLIGDYLQSLLRRLPGLSAAVVPAATRPLPVLLTIALAAASGAGRPADEGERLRRLIDTELGDPRFGPATLVERSGLSRATVYRLFQAQGGLAQVIQRRRVERVRRALEDPDDARPFAAIAFAAGFGSESHASRLFQDAFGTRPGEFRAALHPAGPPPLPLGRMAYWQEEVR